jgi:transcriptional regulator with XRE-family HTH domain
MPNAAVGELVREWRTRRRRSQMDLALDVGVSARHLSFVETGRSKPSAELVLALAEHLDVPRRERNTLLLAAGFAPRHAETPLDAPEMARVRATLQRLLDAHDPYPGVVLDRLWNVVAANRAAAALVDPVPAALAGPPVNVFRISLHPDGLAARTSNFAEWATVMLSQLHRVARRTADAALIGLEAEVTAYPNVQALMTRPGWTWTEDVDRQLLVPCDLEIGGVTLSLFTTLTTFGTAQDITLEELTVELFYPADELTERALLSTTS